ncbi:MAG: DUF3108 domain-containing protein [Halorhodospira sp.]
MRTPSGCSTVAPLPTLLLVAVGLVVAPPVSAADELPESGSARYILLEGGERRGHETLEWALEADDDTYRITRIREHRQNPAGGGYEGDRRIRRTREVSEGALEDDLAQPERYEVRTATVFLPSGEEDVEAAFEETESTTTLSVRFNGEAPEDGDDGGEAEGDEVAVPAGTLDPLTHRWQLMQEAPEAERYEALSHQVVNREGKTEEVTFRVEGRQTVRTPAGTFRAVRLARQDPSRQQAARWYMAEDWAGLPVRTVTTRAEHHAQRTRLERIEQAPGAD